VSNHSAGGVSWVLIVIIVVALAIGAAASILVAASTTPPPSGGVSSFTYTPGWVVLAISLGFIAFVFGVLLVHRFASGPSLPMGRSTLTILITILLGIVFIIAAQFIAHGGLFLSGGGSSPSGSGSGATNNTTAPIPPAPGGGVVTIGGVPGWVPFVILALIALLVAAVAIPNALRYDARRREMERYRRNREAVPAGMQAALSQASSELALGEDPRTVILALYAAILDRLKPLALDVSMNTPEEIRASHLLRLGVRPEPARTLTRLFEEARYSTHPMGADARDRAREAVRLALADLARRSPHG